MKIAIFSRESNPAIDPPCFHADKQRLNMLLATGSVRMLTQRTAQYLTELRDPLKRAAIAKKAYTDGPDNKRQWRVTHQTKLYPGQPVWQMVP